MTRESKGRLLYVVAALIVCFVALEIRLFHIQIIEHPRVEKKAGQRNRKVEDRLAVRGRILTRHGYVLAESVPAVDIYANSKWTKGKRDLIAKELEDLLGDCGVDIRSRLDREGYVRILRRPLANGDQVLELRKEKRKRGLPGIELERTFVRRYPEGSMASSIVGFTNVTGHGKSGIEQTFGDHLRGTPGWQAFQRDARSNPLFDEDYETSMPVPGADVRLTLDVVIQYFVEEAIERVVEEHAPKWASIIVMDPRTGDILGMANRPTFDANHYGNFPLDHQLNRSVTYTYTPGSVFKPFMMAAALERGLVDLNESIDCSSFNEGGRVVRDAHPNGVLTPAEIISKSSNIGIAKIALRLAPEDGRKKSALRSDFERIRQVYTNLGFGSIPEVRMPALAPGRLTHVGNWTRKYTLVSMAFGHEVAVSAVQLASAFSVFANGGAYVSPKIVDAIVTPDGERKSVGSRNGRAVFTRSTADKIKEMLVLAVEEGTGRKAAIDGYYVAGKTSTAQWEKDSTKYTSSFVGFAPANDPRLLVVVVVDQPSREFHTGGFVAAPAAGSVLRRGLAYLRVPEDKN